MENRALLAGNALVRLAFVGKMQRKTNGPPVFLPPAGKRPALQRPGKRSISDEMAKAQ